jgi:uncharacterized beta-barrel protein YwiB (DUF1934 family)
MTTINDLDQINTNDVTVKFDDRHLRMERHGDSYRVTWFKPDENNGAVYVASSVVLSDIAMRATVAAYFELNKEEAE